MLSTKEIAINTIPKILNNTTFSLNKYEHTANIIAISAKATTIISIIFCFSILSPMSILLYMQK